MLWILSKQVLFGFDENFALGDPHSEADVDATALQMWRFAARFSAAPRAFLVYLSLLPSNLETVSGTIG